MLKKTITYVDWNGTERTEDFYFNLSRVEIIELEYSAEAGKTLTEYITDLIHSNDADKILRMIKEIVLKAYGEKSPDGKRFMKSEEISRSFAENPAFDELYMSLMTDAKATADFIAGIMPAAIQESLGEDPSAAILAKMESV